MTQPVAHHREEDYLLVEIVKIVDGDSLHLKVETGWRDDGLHIERNTRAVKRFRLLGIDTPEDDEPGYAKATEFTKTWLLERMVLGTPLRVRTTKQDSFGRWLCTIVDSASGETLNQELLDSENAQVYKR